MSESKVVAKNISMYPEQWEVVEAVDREFGFRNLSQALRIIVDRYPTPADLGENLTNGEEAVSGSLETA